MEKKRNFVSFSTLVTVLLVAFVATSEARTVNFTCGGKGTLTNTIRNLNPGDVLNVSGNCTERVVVPEDVHNIAINGLNATITSPAPSQTAVTIRGTGITISGITITGGAEGILVHRNGMATSQTIL